MQELQHICEEGGKIVLPTVIDVTLMAHERIEARRKNAKLFERNTDMQIKIVEARAAKSTLRSRHVAVERIATAPKRQMDDAGAAHERLPDKASQTEASF